MCYTFMVNLEKKSVETRKTIECAKRICYGFEEFNRKYEPFGQHAYTKADFKGEAELHNYM